MYLLVGNDAPIVNDVPLSLVCDGTPLNMIGFGIVAPGISNGVTIGKSSAENWIIPPLDEARTAVIAL
jgi:hypothetical protein